MRCWLNLRWVVRLVSLWTALGAMAMAESGFANDPSVAERIGNTIKKVGNKVEQGFSKAARKLEEKKVGEKIERKLNKAVTKTEEGVKKAGRKIDEKLR
jgi:F0F1-type ATP synthase membrane subunit b/b'